MDRNTEPGNMGTTEIPEHDDRIGAAVNILRSNRAEPPTGEDDEPSPVTESEDPTQSLDPVETKPPEPAEQQEHDGKPSAADTLADLARAARERRKAADAVKAEREAIESEKAAIAAEREKLQTEMERLRAFEKDPLSAVDDPKALYERVQRMAIDKDRVQHEDKLSAALEEIRALKEEISGFKSGQEEKFKTFEQQRAEEAQRTAQRQFVEFTGRQAEKYRLISKLEPARLASEASHVARQMASEGRQFDYADVADVLESHYAEQLRIFGVDNTQVANAAKQQNGQAAQQQEAAKTLTNQQGSETVSNRVPTDDDRESKAAALLRQGRKQGLFGEHLIDI